MSGKYIAVDVGSSNGKIYAGEISLQRTLDLKEVSRFETPRLIYQGRLCTNIYDIYHEIIKTVAQLGKEGEVIKGLGVDTWASDYGIINESGLIQGLPIFYRDSRTKEIVKYVDEKLGYEQLYHLTTQRKIGESTLLQVLAVLKENPKAFANGGKILFLGDLLMYMLSGTAASEISVASYSQMFNMQKQDFEDKVFEIFDIPKTIKPKVVTAGTKLGKLNTEIAKWCGIKPFDIIAPAVHDTSSAAVVVPAKEGENWAFISTGTWFLVSMELDKPADSTLSFQYNISNTGLAFGKTLAKRNVMAMWLIQECKRIWNRNGLKVDYPMILEAAKQAAPFTGMIDTEYVKFFNPENMPQEISDYLTMTGQPKVDASDVGQIARIIYESIAFECAWSLNALKKVTKKKVDKLYIVGGASAVTILNQYIANVTGLEVVIGPKEASSAGNVMMQAYGYGEISSHEEIREIIRRTIMEERYQSEDMDIWKEQYQKFCEVCNLSDRIS